MISESHALSAQHVLPLWHANRLLSPSDVCAFAQHSVAAIEFSAASSSAGLFASVSAKQVSGAGIVFPSVAA